MCSLPRGRDLRTAPQGRQGTHPQGKGCAGEGTPERGNRREVWCAPQGEGPPWVGCPGEGSWGEGPPQGGRSPPHPGRAPQGEGSPGGPLPEVHPSRICTSAQSPSDCECADPRGSQKCRSETPPRTAHRESGGVCGHVHFCKGCPVWKPLLGSASGQRRHFVIGYSTSCHWAIVGVRAGLAVGPAPKTLGSYGIHNQTGLLWHLAPIGSETGIRRYGPSRPGRGKRREVAPLRSGRSPCPGEPSPPGGLSLGSLTWSSAPSAHSLRCTHTLRTPAHLLSPGCTSPWVGPWGGEGVCGALG